MVYLTQSAKETMDIGQMLAKQIVKQFFFNEMSSKIILLNGDLGAGKTTFAKGFASGLGIQDTITSPTFTISNQYVVDNLQLIKNYQRLDSHLPNQKQSNLKQYDKIDTQTYQNKTINALIHIDAYRLENIDYTETGLEEVIMAKDNICLIEWSQFILPLVQDQKTMSIQIEYINDTTRRISFDE